MTSHAPARIVAVGLSLLLVAYGAVTLASLLARDTQNRSATYQGIATIELDTGFEDVDVVASSGADAVQLTRRWTWSLGEPSVSSRRDGDRLLLSSSCPFSPGLPCTGRITLTVPPDLVLTGGVSDGHLVVEGLTSPLDVHTADGSLDLRGLSGDLRLVTRDGSLRGTGLTSARVSVESSDGSTSLTFARPPSSVRATTRDGSFELALPDDGTAYDVDVDVADGSQDVTVPTASRSARKVRVTARDGSVRVLTASTAPAG
jgi:hypothetical protein